VCTGERLGPWPGNSAGPARTGVSRKRGKVDSGEIARGHETLDIVRT